MEWIMVDMYCTFFPNKEFKANSCESKVTLKFEDFTKTDLVNHLFVKAGS
ncbi:MAG: hypothetical protein K0Q53_2693 [Massilibacillus sp.]|nr:hypothetical protein [Massilibacillus sp.]